ncbi:MAG: glycerol kinase GlpK [Pseudomonadota bacterium]
MQESYIAIDQGTTSSRAIAFDRAGNPIGQAQQEFKQHYPDSGWVEHDPQDLWSTTKDTANQVIAQAKTAGKPAKAVGITNQRETTIIWDRKTGKPIYNAIVWQDRRTVDMCRDLLKTGIEDTVAEKAGLVVDPYFSASKIAWILDHVDGARARAEAGKLAFGTVDTFLIWHLTGGKVHATDATNACRTSLYNLRTNQWDEDLLKIFRVPAAILPEIRDSAADFGETDALDQKLPIRAVLGDQQAAAVGQACFTPGSIKSTYGTGCFVILNTGDRPVFSQHRLLTTVGYRVVGKTSYALEGSIFIAGAVMQWLRDELKMIENTAASGRMAEQSARKGDGGVYLVPAFTGLGAPYWDADARGAMFGLTRNTGPADFVRAGLESVVYQTRDLFAAMTQDGIRPTAVRVDGGMTLNNWFLQFLTDILRIEVHRPKVTETTALGVAMLAAVEIGDLSGFDDMTRLWQADRHFTPAMAASERARRLAGWDQAIARTRMRLGA